MDRVNRYERDLNLAAELTSTTYDAQKRISDNLQKAWDAGQRKKEQKKFHNDKGKGGGKGGGKWTDKVQFASTEAAFGSGGEEQSKKKGGGGKGGGKEGRGGGKGGGKGSAKPHGTK